MKFTKSQQEAIGSIHGTLQLIACAGSGKTEVIARRVVTLLTSRERGGGGCTPNNLVAKPKPRTMSCGRCDYGKLCSAAVGVRP